MGQDVGLLSLRGIVDLMLEGLTPVERLVLKGRFGLWDGKKKTLEEIGKCLGVSRQRVSQLVQEAEKRLRKRYQGREAVSWLIKRKENLMPSFLRACQGMAKGEELAKSVLFFWRTWKLAIGDWFFAVIVRDRRARFIQ